MFRQCLSHFNSLSENCSDSALSHFYSLSENCSDSVLSHFYGLSENCSDSVCLISIAFLRIVQTVSCLISIAFLRIVQTVPCLISIPFLRIVQTVPFLISIAFLRIVSDSVLSHFYSLSENCSDSMVYLFIILIELMYMVFVNFDWTRALSPVCFWFVHSPMNFCVFDPFINRWTVLHNRHKQYGGRWRETIRHCSSLIIKIGKRLKFKNYKY